jgi:hypothetical protein
MKTLTKNNLSLYLLEDDVSVVLASDKITVGDPPKFIIADCNSSDTVLHEGVSKPEEWIGHKYTYDGTGWALNPNFVKSED